MRPPRAAVKAGLMVCTVALFIGIHSVLARFASHTSVAATMAIAAAVFLACLVIAASTRRESSNGAPAHLLSITMWAAMAFLVAWPIGALLAYAPWDPASHWPP